MLLSVPRTFPEFLFQPRDFFKLMWLVDRPTATHGCGWPLDAADVKLCRPFGDALPVTDGVPTARSAAAAPPGRRRGALAATAPPAADPPAARVPWLRLFSPPA